MKIFLTGKPGVGKSTIVQKVGKRDLISDVSVGRVACAVKTKSGKTYTGINIK